MSLLISWVIASTQCASYKSYCCRTNIFQV